MYVPLAGFNTRLTEKITYKTRYLPIPDDDYDYLLDRLAGEDHSFLLIRDGNAMEVVRVVNSCDKIVIERGAELTRTYSFRCGVGVAFIQTAQGVKDLICQMKEGDCQ